MLARRQEATITPPRQTRQDLKVLAGFIEFSQGTDSLLLLDHLMLVSITAITNCNCSNRNICSNINSSNHSTNTSLPMLSHRSRASTERQSEIAPTQQHQSAATHPAPGPSFNRTEMIFSRPALQLQAPFLDHTLQEKLTSHSHGTPLHPTYFLTPGEPEELADC